MESEPLVHSWLAVIPVLQRYEADSPFKQYCSLPTTTPTPLPALHCPDPLAASPNGTAVGFSYSGFNLLPTTHEDNIMIKYKTRMVEIKQGEVRQPKPTDCFFPSLFFVRSIIPSSLLHKWLAYTFSVHIQ
jgi:hypothetical protein